VSSQRDAVALKLIPVPFELGKRPALDGVRGVAILFVMAFHFRASEHALPTRGGFLGVDVFFVLSGFLITALLVEEHMRSGAIRFSAFYARRALRLLPALATVIAVWLAWVSLFDHGAAHGAYREAVAAVLYGENWFHGLSSFNAGPPAGLAHTWSLSIEEQFYILWPAMLWLLLRRGIGFATAATALALAAVPVIRLLQWDADPSVNRLYFSTQTRADTLLAGCLLALLLSNGYLRGRTAEALRWLLPPAFAFVAYSLVFAYHRSPFLYEGGYTVFALATAIVLWGVLERGFIHRLLESRALLWIGRRSYGLYLWHWPVFWVALDYWRHAKIASVVALPLTFLFAWASYRWIELPFLHLKRRFGGAPPIAEDVVVAEAALKPV
jgi:peptidoglycan/LPS O-acetylase OafA/YrhL